MREVLCVYQEVNVQNESTQEDVIHPVVIVSVVDGNSFVNEH